MVRSLVGAAFALSIAPLLWGQSHLTTSLVMDGKLGISLVDAVRIERRLGQLLMVNVDGFGATGELAVTRGYLDLVERLQIGAVIPHYGRCDPNVIRATNAELRRRTREPLLIASDIVTLCAADGTRASFGDGYVGGIIGKYRALADGAFERLAELNAFICKALGMNCALWPTVDSSTRDERTVARARVVIDALSRYGVLVTLKHWPFVPQGVDLHRESVDSAIPLAEVEGLTAPFRELSGKGDLLMTTHVYDSLVDGDLVTLSPRWVQLLQESVGFSGPIVTDGLFMLRSHRERASTEAALPGLGQTGDDEIAGWAARAILAGHDIVIVEGSAATSQRVFERLLELCCRGDELGRRMRERVLAAYDKIMELKRRRAADLSLAIEAPASLVDRVVALVARGHAGLADEAAYSRVAREIAALPRKGD